jgi:sirohydrochlorin ferrochelatase
MRAAVILLLLTLSGAAHAQDDVIDLLPSCKKAYEHPDARKNMTSGETLSLGYCLGVVTSIFDLGPRLSTDEKFCPPQAATPREAMSIVVSYVEAKRSSKQSLYVLGLEALQQAWPCKK